jgi:tetratricopeptide (TPR) repeat protein/transcriptional regulator with XRE-family HTH domain
MATGDGGRCERGLHMVDIRLFGPVEVRAGDGRTDAGSLGELVRAHRRRSGLTQEELAEATGLSVRGIGKIEAGRVGTPRPATVRLLADAFGLSGAERRRFGESAAAEPPGGGTVPAQLPADVAAFAGREHQLATLDRLLATGAPSGSAPVISVISGTAGVGKSTLAVHWAHRVADRFPDGQLFVNLRGFDPGGPVLPPATAVRGLLDALGVPGERFPSTLDGQAALYRSLVHGKRMLVVLDNARNAEQVRPLLPGTPTAMALVTSRLQLTPLVAAVGAHPLALDLMPVRDGRALLAARLGTERVAAEPEAAEAIINACARLPLAIAITAARARLTGFPLADVARDLADAERRLDLLDAGDPATQVRAVLSWSYAALSAGARRLFRLLGLLPGPDISAAAAASLAGRSRAATVRLLAELTRANLLTEHAPSRYTFHDLLRAYAAELVRRVDPGGRRHAATGRLLDHYLHSAYAADRRLYRTRDPIPVRPPRPGVTPERPADHDHALAWLTVEHAVLVAAVDHAAAAGLDTHTWQLAWTLATVANRRALWRDWVATARAGVAAARRLADPTVQAHAHRNLADAYIRLDRPDQALTQLRHALARYRHTGDLVGQARTQNSLANLRGRQDRHAEALHHARQALHLFDLAGHRPGQAHALNAVGWHHARLGQHEQSIGWCRRALSMLEGLDERDGQPNTWDSLGYSYHHLGRHAEAAHCYARAVDLFGQLGDRYNQATALRRLGDNHEAAGDPVAARDAWQRAADILTDLRHVDGDRLRARLQAPRPRAA